MIFKAALAMASVLALLGGGNAASYSNCMKTCKNTSAGPVCSTLPGSAQLHNYPSVCASYCSGATVWRGGPCPGGK